MYVGQIITTHGNVGFKIDDGDVAALRGFLGSNKADETYKLYGYDQRNVRCVEVYLTRGTVIFAVIQPEPLVSGPNQPIIRVDK